MNSAVPRFINFHITNRCGNQCRHCEMWRVAEPPAPEPAVFVRAVDELADWLGPTEMVVAGGEPLLSPAALPVLERGARRGMKTALATNGFHVDAAAAQRLADAGLGVANVSLDGFDHTHDRIRNRPGAFDQVLRAIGFLRDAGVPVRVATVILADNLDQITGLLDFLRQDGRVSGVFFQAMAQPFGAPEPRPGWWRTHPHFPRDVRRVQALCDELLAMKRGGFFILNDDAQFPALKAYFANPDRFTLARCNVSRIGLTINAAGDVLLCNFLEPIGRIGGPRVREIYDSPAADRLRARMAACDVNCHLLLNCCFDPAQLITD
jgi:MoaA/NifB/PqqE/SkfB family radical SAM enzyme